MVSSQTRPEQTPLAKLRVEISKGKLSDLLQPMDVSTQQSKLEHALSLALSVPSSTSSLSLDQLSLLTATLKSISSAYGAPTQLPTFIDSTVPTLLSLLYTPPKQLSINQSLALSIDSPHKGLSSQALLALEVYISLGSPSRADVDFEPLAKRSLESPQLSKSSIQTLTLLVPVLPLSTFERLSPTLLAELLKGFSDRHLSQARGKLVSQLVLSSLRSSPNDTQKLLLRSLLAYDDTSRFNISAFTLRHVAEQSLSFLVDLVNLLSVDPTFNAHPSRPETFICLASLANTLSQCTDISSDPSYPSPDTAPRVFLPESAIRSCLSHPSPSVRLGAFSLITDKMNSSSLLSSVECDIIQEFIGMNINSGENETRHQIVHRFSKLLHRMKASTFAAYRDASKLASRENRTSAEEAEMTRLLEDITQTQTLLSWLGSFFVLQPGPLASFPRTILSLRLLELLFSSGFYSDVVATPFSTTAVPSTQIGKGSSNNAISFPFYENFLDFGGSVTALVRCLTSTYGEVRLVGIDLLERLKVPPPGLDSPEKLDFLEKEAFNLSCNPRGSESSGGALALRLVCKLRFGDDEAGQARFVSSVLDRVQERLDTSKTDIVRAARDLPVHGLLQLLQEILSRITPTTSTLSLWQPIFHRTLSTVQAVWEATRGVLSASPALGTSEDAEAVDHEEARALLAIEASAGDEGEGGETGSVGLKHQIVLSWAWRGIKESSSLLSAITTLPLRLASRPAAKGLSSSTDSGPPLIWSRQDLETAGSHFITLLTEIRHPGVFLAIYPNYSDLVSAIAKSSPSSTLGSVEMKTLPRKWLDAHLAALNVEQHTSGRRSAGLPYGVLAVMIADPSTVAVGFEEILQLARSSSETIAVAAVNTLQVLLADAKLSTSFPIFFEQAVIIALDSMRSSSWAVRNVGLLLIGNLVKRAFDQKSQDVESYTSRQEFSTWFARYPKLLPLFVELLQKNETEGSTFAVLQVLKNLRAGDGTSKEVISALQSLARSKKLDIREAASNALPSVVPLSSIPSFLSSTLQSASSTSSQNQRHGLLLQMIALARCYLNTTASSSSSSSSKPLPASLIDELAESTETLLVENPCAPTQALFLQLLALLSSRSEEQLPLYEALIYCSQLARARLTPGAATISREEEEQETDEEIQIRRPRRTEEEQDAEEEAAIATAAEEPSDQPQPSPSPGSDLLHLAAARFLLSQASSTLTSELISSTLLGTGDETAEIVLIHAEDNASFASTSFGLVTTKALITRAIDRSSARCRQLALRLFAGRTAEEAGSYKGLEVVKLLKEFDETRNEPLKEDLLPVIARLIAAKTESCDSLSGFLDRLDVASKDFQSENMRTSASIAISHLAPLIYPSDASSPAPADPIRFRFRLLIIRLLEDDDFEIRATAASLVSQALGKPPLSHEYAVEAWWEHCRSAVRSAQHRKDWQEWIWKQFTDESEIEFALSTLNSPISTLFTREAPNRYFEPLEHLQRLQLALNAEVPFLDSKSYFSQIETLINSVESRLQPPAQPLLLSDPSNGAVRLLDMRLSLAVEALDVNLSMHEEDAEAAKGKGIDFEQTLALSLKVSAAFRKYGYY